MKERKMIGGKKVLCYVVYKQMGLKLKFLKPEDSSEKFWPSMIMISNIAFVLESAELRSGENVRESPKIWL